MSGVVTRLDAMIEQAVAVVALGDQTKIKALVRAMAERWPDEKALSLAFALTTAAARIEEFSESREVLFGPPVAYRVAALVAADTLAVEALGRAPALCRDLLVFWRRVDPWFLGG